MTQSPFFKPLIPLPTGQDTPSTQQPASGQPSSPFSSLFDSPPPPLVSTSGATRPLFPIDVPSSQQRRPSRASVSESPNSPFGEFVSVDPLQQSFDSFSPSVSPYETRLNEDTHSAPSQSATRPPPQTSSEGDILGLGSLNLNSAFKGNEFVEGAAARSKERNAQVLSELLDHEDDPLYFFRSGTSREEILATKEAELLEEIAAHEVLPHTPRASRTGSPTPGGRSSPVPPKPQRQDSDESIIDLITGERIRGTRRNDPTRDTSKSSSPRSRPIAIANATSRKPNKSSQSVSGSNSRNNSPGHRGSGGPSLSPSTSSSYLNLTLSRRWGSFLSNSPSAQPSSPPTVTRQQSLGQFTGIPHSESKGDKDLTESPTMGSLAVLQESAIASGPFTRKPFIPPTGAPGFRPDENWNPSGFHFDVQSRKDTLGDSVKLLGRSEATTKVLTPPVADSLRPFLPAIPRLSSKWTLLYSTDQHGISITTFYRNVEKVYAKGGGCFLAVKEVDDDDDDTACFGVWIGDGIKCQDGAYYGSGESFLWKTKPRENNEGPISSSVYKWTGRNEYIALCETGFLSFGGGDGKYGLYIDAEFIDGSSEKCETFDNQVLCHVDGASDRRKRFECLAVEAWWVGA